ncbi:MAG: MFS transporter, partial [Anaplasmataceae bacterium]|nr:MFS transporter [Anaplasmataceae bacterium]
MPQLLKIVIYTVFSNSLVWYDYALYGKLINYISNNFMPNSSDNVVIGSFIIFSIGFFFRPLGAILFGFLGDKYGRKLSLVISTISITLPMLVLTLLPSYKEIGIYSLLTLLLVRILQGLSLGGEAGTALLLIENAPKKLKGLFGSLEVLCAIIGAVLCELAIIFAKNIVSPEIFGSWGWRIPFALGFTIGIIGVIFRFLAGESPVFLEYKEKLKNKINSISFKESLRLMVTKYRSRLLIAISIDALEEVSIYIFFVFLGVFIEDILFNNESLGIFNSMHFIFLIVLGASTLFFAYLSDIWCRKKIVLFAAILSIFSSFLIFALVINGGWWSIMLANLLLVVVIGASLGPINIMMTQLFDMDFKYLGFALSRNISSAIFGGLAPVISIGIIKFSGINILAGLYLFIISIITLIG